MRTLSAFEAISPAIARTRDVLFRPFLPGRTWKLAITAYLGMGGTAFLPFPLVYLFFVPMLVRTGRSGTALAALIGIFVVCVLFLVLFYVFSRLQFAHFDIVLHRGQFVAPAWRKYGSQNAVWTAFKVLIGTLAMAIAAAPIATYVHHLWPVFKQMSQLPPGQPMPPQFIGIIFGAYGLFLLVFGSFFLISLLLTDFALPSLALENTTLGETLRRCFQLIRQQPGQFALYVLAKILLGFGGYLAVIISFEILFFFVILIVGIVAFIIGFLLHLAGVSTTILTAIGIALAVLIYLFFIFYVMLMAIGTLITFLQAHALYFLGGRYLLLGNILEPLAVAEPFTSPPPPPSKDEDDNDSGPIFPMNPAPVG